MTDATTATVSHRPILNLLTSGPPPQRAKMKDQVYAGSPTAVAVILAGGASAAGA
jgi:hypothetical protein